jgi:hypothetical protein
LLLRIIKIVPGRSRRYRPFFTASINALARRPVSGKRSTMLLWVKVPVSVPRKGSGMGALGQFMFKFPLTIGEWARSLY